VARAAEEEVASCLRQAGAGRPRHGQLAALLEAAHSRVAAKRLAVALSVKVRAPVRQIQVLEHEITALEQASVAAFAELGHAPSYNAASRTYFDQRTTAGKNKMNTRVAIGRKLLCTILAILRTGRPYDPAYRHSTALSVSAVA
jgi:hypothetical protein